MGNLLKTSKKRSIVNNVIERRRNCENKGHEGVNGL